MLHTFSDSTVRLQATQTLMSDGSIFSLRRMLPFIGPSMIAAVAYIDPGNFATNIEAGSRYGYTLLWVVLFANVIAMLIQTMSARLGLATGKNLAELIRQRASKRLVWFYWIQAEIVAMATDLAEFLGAALAFHLLFGMSLMQGALLTGVITYAALYMQRYGFRTMEIMIAAMVLAVSAGFLIEVFISHPDMQAMTTGLLTPQFPDHESIYLAAGMLGATVMPHVIYLHSSLSQNRLDTQSESQKQTAMKFYRLDVLFGMALAGLINMAILILAAALFQSSAFGEAISISEAYLALGAQLTGQIPQLLFGFILLICGLSSSIVGTMSGQVIMQGFMRFRIPLWLRRGITMAPALIIILMGVSEQQALVWSQIVLSFGIPFALIPLLKFTSDQNLMGKMANTSGVQFTGVICASLIICMNIYVIWNVFT